MRPSERSRGARLSRRALGRRLPFLGAALAGSACAQVPLDPGRPWHHTPDGFRNPQGSPERGGDFGDWASFFYRNFRRPTEVALPAGHVVAEETALAQLARAQGDSLTWLGHASFLIRLAGRTLLTDPFLSEHASPLSGFGPKRFAPPGLSVRSLPPLDVLLLSHNHYDHLDLPTLEAIADRARVEVVAPLGLRTYFTRRGYGRVHEVDWRQSVRAKGIEITALPAIHFSRRTLFDRNRTLWAGYAIAAAGKRLHFAGDTAYGPVYPKLGAKLAPFDASLVPIGAYEPRELMRGTHATPEEVVRIGLDLRARRVVAMHWGTIQLTDEPPFEPPGRFLAAAREGGYAADDAWVMAIGETRPL